MGTLAFRKAVLPQCGDQRRLVFSVPLPDDLDSRRSEPESVPVPAAAGVLAGEEEPEFWLKLRRVSFGWVSPEDLLLSAGCLPSEGEVTVGA